MAEEPYKRRKLSEDLPRTLADVIVQNTMLSTQVSEVSRTWAALIADLDAMLRSVSTPAAVSSDTASAFDFSFVRYPNTDEALERLSELIKAKFAAFLSAMQQSPNTDSWIRLTEQSQRVLSMSSELNIAHSEKAQLLDKVHILTDQVDKLKMIKEEIDNMSSSRPDQSHHPSNQLRDLSDKLDRLTAEKDNLRQQRDEYIEKLQKAQVELDVSEERFLRTKAYTLLTKQMRGLALQLKDAKEKQDVLQRWKTDQQNAKHREMQEVARQEELRRADLVKRIKEVQTEHAEVIKEKADLLLTIEQLKREKAQTRHMDEYKSLIDEIENEKLRLKSQATELRRQNDELTNKAEADLKQILELQDQVYLLGNTGQSSQSTGGDQSRVDHYAKELGDLREQIKSKDNQIATLEKKISILKDKLKKEASTSEMLIEEVEVTGKAYAEYVKKNRTLTSQLVEQEQTFARLMSEQRKDVHWKALHEAEKAELIETLKRKDESIDRQRQLVKEYEHQDETQQHEIVMLSKKLADMEDRLRHFQKTHEDSFRQAEEVAKVKQDGHDAIQILERKIITFTTQTLQAQFQQSQLAKELDTARQSLARSRSNDTYSSDLALCAELAKYRKMVRCNVCCSRPKDVVLMDCLHAFCRICVEKCLAMQKRKCPHCLARFAAEDVRAFWWK